MPALAPDTTRTPADPLADLTAYLREDTDTESPGPPVDISDSTRALAIAVPEYSDTRRTMQLGLLINELSTAGEPAGRHSLHYALNDPRDPYGNSRSSMRGCCSCR
ncbi:hypothetical protein ACWEIK_22365 [Streptomyces sp. NPDC004673]